MTPDSTTTTQTARIIRQKVLFRLRCPSRSGVTLREQKKVHGPRGQLVGLCFFHLLYFLHKTQKHNKTFCMFCDTVIFRKIFMSAVLSWKKKTFLQLPEIMSQCLIVDVVLSLCRVVGRVVRHQLEILRNLTGTKWLRHWHSPGPVWHRHGTLGYHSTVRWCLHRSAIRRCDTAPGWTVHWIVWNMIGTAGHRLGLGWGWVVWTKSHPESKGFVRWGRFFVGRRWFFFCHFEFLQCHCWIVISVIQTPKTFSTLSSSVFTNTNFPTILNFKPDDLADVCRTSQMIHSFHVQLSTFRSQMQQRK